jgi:hypothetical protein
MKTTILQTLASVNKNITNSVGRKPCVARRRFLLVPLVLVCFALSPQMQALSPPPDGGYPNGNTAEGDSALSGLTGGFYNSALGFLSLLSNADASFNTGVGAGTLLVNTANENTAVGAGALLSNTTGGTNTAVGAFAMFTNSGGSSDTAIGVGALQNDNGIGSNTGTGFNALFANTTGFNNAAFGIRALETNIDGQNNTALGNLALDLNSSGSGNTAVGRHAGDGITGGNNNVCVGTFSGTAITTGSNIITIGPVSGVHSIFGQVSDRTYIANILGASVDSGTAAFVFVDADGRLGTVPAVAGPERDAPGVHPEGVRPQTVPDAAKQAMLNLKVEKLQAMVAEQKEQIESLSAQMKEQAAQIQKVSAQLEVSKPAARVVSYDH